MCENKIRDGVKIGRIYEQRSEMLDVIRHRKRRPPHRVVEIKSKASKARCVIVELYTIEK